MVGLNRLELLTSRLSGVRSNQLSYSPSGVVFIRKLRNDMQGPLGPCPA